MWFSSNSAFVPVEDICRILRSGALTQRLYDLDVSWSGAVDLLVEVDSEVLLNSVQVARTQDGSGHVDGCWYAARLIHLIEIDRENRFRLAQEEVDPLALDPVVLVVLRAVAVAGRSQMAAGVLRELAGDLLEGAQIEVGQISAGDLGCQFLVEGSGHLLRHQLGGAEHGGVQHDGAWPGGLVAGEGVRRRHHSMLNRAGSGSPVTFNVRSSRPGS